jgi:transposase-like protein
VDDLVKALGADTGISKSEVSRICADLDAEVGAFRDRSLAEAAFPYVFLDATYCKARVNRRVVSQAVVVATGVRADGWREVLGFAVGDSEDGAFWTAFLRSLKARGLAGVQLVISDAHTGLKQAIAASHLIHERLATDPTHCRKNFSHRASAVRPRTLIPHFRRTRAVRACWIPRRERQVTLPRSVHGMEPAERHDLRSRCLRGSS